MAKEWKKIQRSDEDYTGKVTGTIDGTSVADIKSGASAGTASKVVTDAAFDGSNVLKESNAAAGLKNSGVTINADGTLSGAGSGQVTPAGVGAVDTDLSNAPDAIKNSETTKTDVGLDQVVNESPSTLKTTMSLNNVENKNQATILGGNLTGTIGGTANATVVSGAADGATIKPAFDTSGSDPIIKVANAPSTLKNASISINSDGSLTGAGSGSVSATGLGAIKTDLANAPTTILNSNTTKSDVGLDQVTNESKTTMFTSPTFSGTVAGVSKTHVGLGSVSNITTTAIREGVTKDNVGLGSVDNTADSAKPVSTAQAASIATKAPTANPTFTGTVAGVSKGMVGLGSVVDQAITVASGKIKFDGTAQTIDADKIGGSTLNEAKTAAATLAEGNILDGAPAGLQTLNELAAALNDDASFNTTVTNSIATKGPAPLTLTAEDVDGDSTFSSAANTPSNLIVGQVGVFGGNQYVVVDV
tara:strand:- start:1100 stop:2524 length:1425 start_codon:yes stop_codon:yes gene_type:complete